MESHNGGNFSSGNRILQTFLSLLCCLLSAAGDEIVTLQEVEGTNITLHTGITGIQGDAQMLWFYEAEKVEEKILNSQMFKGETVTEISERFKDRLQLDRTSGALTIRNIRRNHSGVYLLQIITGRLSSRTFRLSVYAPVSTPVINLRSFLAPVSTPVNSKKISQLSTESCSFMCCVENGEDVRLSWYRENERISITNKTDLSVPLHLPLQIQQHDNKTYICVSANPVSNKTTSLNITQLCNSGSDRCCSLIPALISAAVFVLIIIFVFVWILLKKKKQQVPDKPEGLTYADITVTDHRAVRTSQNETEGDEVMYSHVKRSK